MYNQYTTQIDDSKIKPISSAGTRHCHGSIQIHVERRGEEFQYHQQDGKVPRSKSGEWTIAAVSLIYGPKKDSCC
jgi:hypothetical protein